MSSNITRRGFLKSASAASSAAMAFPAILRARAQSPNNRLNVACVGVGGRGRAAVGAMAAENRVAFCDVDDARAAETYERLPDVPRFRDYRRMLDKLGNQIDAVTISTPDHMHYPIAVAALQLGKHVFVEKPLTHTIREARQLAKLAREKKVATQMGNQGHANDGTRILKEWIAAGVLGDVREIRTWTNRPVWPQGVKAPDHSKMIPVKPDTLDWDLWLGVAAARPYDPAYLPFNWRGYWDFGTGALGDMGCHLMDGAYWALDLGHPTKIAATSANANDVSGPTASVVTYEFPARGTMPALKWVWQDGGLQSPLPDELEEGRQLLGSGNFIIGSKATVLTNTYYDSIRIIPEVKMREIAPTLPPKTLPRIEGGHFAEWVRACKGGPPAGSNFEYAARLTEICLLSNLAVRARRPLVWDGASMEVTNFRPAAQYLSKEYRPGFGV
jgi:predicted dehydrogenase